MDTPEAADGRATLITTSTIRTPPPFRNFRERSLPRVSVSRRLPDHFAEVDQQLDVDLLQLLCWFVRHAHLSAPNADCVVEPLVLFVRAGVPCGHHDLPPAFRVGATIPLVVKQDRGAVLRLDHALEVWSESEIRPPPRMVGAPKRARKRSRAAAFGQKEKLLFLACGSFQRDFPIGWVYESHRVERLEDQLLSFEFRLALFAEGLDPFICVLGHE